jgi:hypothetical protein
MLTTASPARQQVGDREIGGERLGDGEARTCPDHLVAVTVPDAVHADQRRLEFDPPVVRIP